MKFKRGDISLGARSELANIIEKAGKKNTYVVRTHAEKCNNLNLFYLTDLKCVTTI